MMFQVFNNSATVHIKDELVNLYENNVAEMNQKRVEYLIASSGPNETVKSLDQIVQDAIVEEVNMYRAIPGIIKEIKNAKAEI